MVNRKRLLVGVYAVTFSNVLVGTVLLITSGSNRRAEPTALPIAEPNRPLLPVQEELPKAPKPATTPERSKPKSSEEIAQEHYLRGKELWLKGDQTRALVEINHALELNPKSAMPHLVLWCIYQENGRWDESLVEYATAATYDMDCLNKATSVEEFVRYKATWEAQQQRAYELQRQETLERLKVKYALLNEGETQFLTTVAACLEAGDFAKLETLELNRGIGAGTFISFHWDFFDSPEMKARMIEWADWAGVGELIDNLNLHQSKKLVQIKIHFALMDNVTPKMVRSSDGRFISSTKRRPEKTAAITFSRQIKNGAPRFLLPEQQEFLKAHLILFEEALGR
jgi:hypothetical protein